MENIGQHFLGGFQGTSITKEIKDLIQKDKILGFTLFKRNIESLEQVRELNLELQSLAKQAGYQLILAVDQEGGRVARLNDPFVKLPPMEKIANLAIEKNNPNIIFAVGKILAEQSRAAGFNLDFAPVCDVNSNPNNPIIGDRSFSHVPETVAKFSKEIILAFWDTGIQGCLKHFPGHGDTKADSHLELPIDDRKQTQILDCDLIPFQKLIEKYLAPSLMTAHVLYADWDPKYPATLSETILNDFLREKLQYREVIFSDDFLMKAIADHYDFFQASKRFFEIGGDVVLICDEIETMQNLFENYKNSILDNDFNVLLDVSKKRIKQFKTKIDFTNPRYKFSELISQHQEILKSFEIDQLF